MKMCGYIWGNNLWFKLFCTQQWDYSVVFFSNAISCHSIKTDPTPHHFIEMVNYIVNEPFPYSRFFTFHGQGMGVFKKLRECLGWV